MTGNGAEKDTDKLDTSLLWELSGRSSKFSPHTHTPYPPLLRNPCRILLTETGAASRAHQHKKAACRRRRPRCVAHMCPTPIVAQARTGVNVNPSLSDSFMIGVPQ